MFGRLFAGERDRAISVAILVRGSHEFSADDLAARLRSRGIKAERSADAPRQSVGMVLNGQPLMIAPEFPAVPPGQLADLCEGAWWWPDAHERCRDHSHVIALGVPEARGDRIERRRLASEAALALARAHDASAILWRDAEAVHEPDHVQRLLDGDALAAPLWVSIRVAELAGARFFFTTGLEAFDHRELEMNVPPRESLDDTALLYQLMSLALKHKTRIAPGPPLGRTVHGREEKLVVSIEASRIPGRRDVVRLTRE